MQASGPSTSKPRFDPQRLLSEIQTSQSTPRSHDDNPTPATDNDDEDDFMSDKYLLTTEPKQPLTYTDKRRKLEAHYSTKTKPLKQQEEEARQEGLDRDLLAEAEIVAGGGKLPIEEGGKRRWDLLQPEEVVEDGRTKAMKMMLAMGYRRGEALGKRTTDTESVEEEDEEDEASPPSTPSTLGSDEQHSLTEDLAISQGREEDDYLTGGVSASTSAARPSTEPLRPDQRWLGINRRAGIGVVRSTPAEVSKAILAASSKPSTPATAESDFRTRIAEQQVQRHTANLLSRARATLLSLDSTHDIHYSPLWLDPDLHHQLAHTASSIESIAEKYRSDPALRQAVELLQLAFAQEELKEDAQTFIELDTKTQLGLILDRLRAKYAYCLFCGCQYDTAKELEQLCPGTTEDDHD